MAAPDDADADGHAQAHGHGHGHGPPPAHLPDELTLVTLNCWGLLHISDLRAPRLAEIGRRVARLDPPPDVVCLQECWVRDDFAAVARALAPRLPHAKFFHSGAFGAGLALVSRFPVEATAMLPYPLNGRPTAFWRGDWYVGKGVAHARLRIGPRARDVVDVFNTHTHAPYESGPDDSYLCHRIAQAWEMAKLLRAAAAPGHLVVALGDFNMYPRSLAHRIITARAPLRDVWRVLHPDSSLGPADCAPERARRRPVPSAAANLRDNGCTSDGLYNTWRWPRHRQRRLRAGSPCPVDADADDVNGKRLDYIFASTGAAPDAHRWVVKSAAVALTERHPSLHVSLSDHFAVHATLKLHVPAAAPDAAAASPYDAQLLARPNDDDAALTLADYDEVLAVTRRYAARERSQRRHRAARFFAALAVWVACLVAVWWSPRNFVAFLLVLVASLVLAAGAVEGLLALLFFSSEIRRLQEFEWEICNARAAALSAQPADADEAQATPA